MIDFPDLWMGGSWSAPSSTDVIEVRSPDNEQVLGRAPEARDGDVDRAVTAARGAFDHGPWPRLTRGAGKEAVTSRKRG
jgi:betaine-aldehyde dehydrogenase